MEWDQGISYGSCEQWKKNQLVILPNVLGVNQSILGIPAKHESIDFPIGLDTSHVRHTCASQLVQQWGGIPQNGNFHEDDDDKSINSWIGSNK